MQSIIFIHGGPGMDSSYFGSYFEELSQKYNLVFYNQLYNEKQPPKLSDLLKQLRQAVMDHKPCYVLAHSWGGFLILKAIAENIITKDDLEGIILIAPMSLTRERLKSASASLKDRLSSEHKQRLETIWQTDDFMKAGRDFLGMVTPYYHYDRAFELQYSGIFHYHTWQALNKETGDYDVSNIVNVLPKHLIIYGSADYLQPEPEYSKENIHIINEAGHYPFAEKQKETLQVIETFLEI